MKNIIVSITVLFITIVTVLIYPKVNQSLANQQTINAQTNIENTVLHVSEDIPRIQLAILLDTSNSMDGLIDQAKNQLWQVVNEFSLSKKNGITPRLEVAVYEYGNDNLSSENGYIRLVTPLTTELDQVSEALFSLSTNGGSEYCGYVIDTAVRQLSWSISDNDIRTIFIAGNEPFTQGPVVYSDAITAAQEKRISVNTIHAGDYNEGSVSGWKDGAILAGGDYMSINHNHQIVHVIAPQDQRIAELNSLLNNTYVPYGAFGKIKHERQLAEDKKSLEISEGLMAKRAESKASKLYNNRSWDLVDAVKEESVEIESIPADELPEEMQSMKSEERKAYVSEKAREREQIQNEIASLSRQRKTWVAQQPSTPDADTLDEAIISVVRKQARSKSYEFVKEE